MKSLQSLRVMKNRIQCWLTVLTTAVVLAGAGRLRGQTPISGTYDGAIIVGNIVINPGTSATFTGGTIFTGANATFYTTGLNWQQTGTLSGKALTFGNGTVTIAGAGNSLTLAATTTVTGTPRFVDDGSTGTAFTNQGNITHTNGESGAIYSRTTTNSGNITATAGTLRVGSATAGYTAANSGNITASASTIRFDGGISNTGAIRAENNGQLWFMGNQTTSGLGNIVLETGGRAFLFGALDNAGATLNAFTGGSLELIGGSTITGGTIASGALAIKGGGTLNGVNLQGPVSIAAQNGAYLAGNTTFSSSATTLGDAAYLRLYSDNAKLTIAANSSVSGDISILADTSSGTAITNQGTITHNSTTTGNISSRNTTNSGNITATAGTLTFGVPTVGYTTTNSGNITADGSGVVVNLDGGLSNSGTLAARNGGQLVFRGTNGPGVLGTIQLESGGRALLTGEVYNTSLAAPTGGTLELQGGTIFGGTIAAGALSFTSAGGYLSGATLNDHLELAADAYVRLTDSASFTGATATLGTNASLLWEQVGTLSGKSITLADGAYVYVSGANRSLTLAATSSLTGAVNVASGGAAGTVFTNQGNLTHSSAATGEIYSRTATNSGNITAAAGTLSLGLDTAGYSFTNAASGTIRTTGAGAAVHLRGNFTNSGTLDIQSGALHPGTQFSNAAGGVVRGAGTIVGNLTFAGGTIAPGNSLGTLTIASGTLAVGGASTFAVELGGASSDLLLFQNPPANVNLGAGLVTLSLTLLSAPTAGTYTIIRIGSGTAAITGSFAELATSGTTFTSSFEGVSYVFAIDYQTDTVNLNLVGIPEPSAYALVLGCGALWCVCFRRRARRSVRPAGPDRRRSAAGMGLRG